MATFPDTCQVKKNFVSVSKNVHKQKKLLLKNLNKLFLAFKTLHPEIEIGFLKFYILCPKYCVTISSLNSHIFGVCSVHQNAKNAKH